jgi:hypothetical protein
MRAWTIDAIVRGRLPSKPRDPPPSIFTSIFIDLKPRVDSGLLPMEQTASEMRLSWIVLLQEVLGRTNCLLSFHTTRTP